MLPHSGFAKAVKTVKAGALHQDPVWARPSRLVQSTWTPSAATLGDPSPFGRALTDSPFGRGLMSGMVLRTNCRCVGGGPRPHRGLSSAFGRDLTSTRCAARIRAVGRIFQSARAQTCGSSRREHKKFAQIFSTPNAKSALNLQINSFIFLSAPPKKSQKFGERGTNLRGKIDWASQVK